MVSLKARPVTASQAYCAEESDGGGQSRKVCICDVGIPRMAPCIVGHKIL